MSQAKSITPGLWTMPKGEFEESVAALERAVVAAHGAPVLLFDRFRTDPTYAARIAHAMLSDGAASPLETRLAQLIMGRNIFTDADWMSYYNATFTKRQLREAGKFPWGEEILNGPCPFTPGKLVKDTHFAFLGIEKLNGVPLTVAQLLTMHPGPKQPKFYHRSAPWHAGQFHTDVTTMQLRWYLMLKNIVPGSVNQTSEEQIKLLPPEYEVPSTIAEVTKSLLVFRKMQERCNPSVWAACAERTIGTPLAYAGSVSCVGNFGENGLNVSIWDCNRCGIGVGASRKL